MNHLGVPKRRPHRGQRIASPNATCQHSLAAPLAVSESLAALGAYAGFHHGLLATILPLLLAACGPETEASSAIAIDSAGVRIVNSDPSISDATCTLSEEPLLVLGEDEADERQWFSNIRGAGRLSDGSVVAIDRATAEVRIFNEAGKHLRSIGRHGEGPGEFEDPFQLWITAGDTLWVGDYYPWRYNLFTAKGEFAGQVNLTPVFPNSSTRGGVLDNGYNVNSRSKRARRENFTVPDTLIAEVHDRYGQRVGTLARMPDRTSGVVAEAPDLWIFPLFQSFAQIDADGSTIVLAHGKDTEVRVLDDELNLRLIIRWIEPEREVTGADIRAWREDYIKSQTRPAAREWSRFEEARISDDRPVADLVPAISSVTIGRDGGIWVRQYDRPREDRGWLAFGPGGEFVCHLAQLPGSVWEFGADYVLLRRETELGIQTVHMHRLNHPDISNPAS